MAKAMVMTFLQRHPSADELAELATASHWTQRSRAAEHVERCDRCRRALELLRGATVALKEMPARGPSPALRARILSSRAQGVRTILPAGNVARPPRDRRLLPLAAAGLLAAVGGLLVARTTREVEGSGTTGTLVLSPAMPRAGARVTVRYEPEARLARERWLALRARMRSPNGGEYNIGIPTTTIALLRRDAKGVFTGGFAFPDSIVYAALVVEDSAASIVDDHGGRDWEVLISQNPGVPSVEALDQRVHDMMGRNWEEAVATARRMVALYPDDPRAWLRLRTFQGW